MELTVAHKRYKLALTDERPVFEDGSACLGICHFETRMIEIWKHVPHERRLEVLVHELIHAWQEAMPVRIDEEALADIAGIASSIAIQDAQRQPALLQWLGLSGVPKELEYAPPEVWDEVEKKARAWASGQRPSAERAYCPICTRAVCGSEIKNAEPAWDERWHLWKLERSMYCDHCDHVITWSEAGEKPSGIILSGPDVVMDPAKVRAFLEAHPWAAGGC